MEISPISSSEMEAAYLCSLVFISGAYMIAGFLAVQTTELSNSVSQPVMSLFKYCFYLFTFYSISRGSLVTSRALFVSPQSVEPAARKYFVEDSAVKFIHLVLFLFTCSSLPIRHFSPVGVCIFVIPLSLFLFYQRIFCSHWMKLLRRVLDSSSLDLFTTWLPIYMSAHDKTNFLLPLIRNNKKIVKSTLIKNNKKIVNIIKFAVGMTGSVFFQNYFKLNSFQETLAFLYFAVSWLANITLLSATDDFGVFNFILSNVVVGSTVAEGGLGAHTWLAFTASVLLYSLRLMLQSIPSINGRFMHIRVNIVIFILFTIVYYGAYLVLFVYRTHLLSDSRPLLDR